MWGCREGEREKEAWVRHRRGGEGFEAAAEAASPTPMFSGSTWEQY